MELGGNIVLEGFDKTEPEKLIVIKKIAGSFAKKVGEKEEYKKVILELSENYKITINLKLKQREITSENKDQNLFFALTNAIKEVEAQI
tara:strand:+ start:133 stop:399 length:267 start_codon:yes stop_codon:yes gene_type:complete